jgi:phospholipid/cholesterol/gamma-HCH transport system permease protein
MASQNRILYSCFLVGRLITRLGRGRFYGRNLLDQLVIVGPGSFRSVIAINFCAGLVFTLQSARELQRYGAIQGVGGAFAIAFCRELAPILTAGVMAGQIGSAFAAELASMGISEQLDALRMMRVDPIDYLVVPRLLACGIMVPVLTLFSLFVGVMGGLAIATLLYNQDAGLFLGSVQLALSPGDLIALLGKAIVFGGLIALIGCSWGLTADGGAQGVGQAATTAVVSCWVAIFVADLLLSFLIYGGLGG